MTSCCTVDAQAPGGKSASCCPACGQKGKAVGGETVKAMLSVSLRHLFPETPYRFCASPTCDVVYYSAGTRFRVAEIRVPVYQKAGSDMTVPVCYCFRHSPDSIRREWERLGRSTVVEEVSAGIQAGQCACELRNPQGRCCLGNVRQVVATMTDVRRSRHSEREQQA